MKFQSTPDTTARPTRWLVAFTGIQPSSHWVRRLLTRLPHPQHVRAFRQAPPCAHCGALGPLLLVEHTLSRLAVTVTPHATEEIEAALVRSEGGIVIEATVPADADERFVPRLGNCVTAMRALLAMRPWPQTASRLAAQLRALCPRAEA